MATKTNGEPLWKSPEENDEISEEKKKKKILYGVDSEEGASVKEERERKYKEQNLNE